jgi:hypothetical protein
MSTSKTVVLGAVGVQVELIAAGTIKPGMLTKRASATTCAVHATSAGTAQKMFAVEDLGGNALTGTDLEDNYVAGDRVFNQIFKPGDVVNALIADGQNIAIGDWLESNGNGYLKKHDAVASAGEVLQPNSLIGIALEAVDMSGSAGVDPSPRCAVEIL